MDRSKIYEYGKEGFRLAVVEGDAISFREGIQRYLNKGRYRQKIDFSPVLLGSCPGEDFMVANIYGQNFLTLTAVQNRSQNSKSRTSFSSNGNGEHALDFLVDLSEIFELEAHEAPGELIEAAKIAFVPLFTLYKGASDRFGSTRTAARIVSEALRFQQKTYLLAARADKSRYN